MIKTYNINSNNDLYFQQQADDKDIVFQSDDGSGGVSNYLQLDGSEKFVRVQQTYIKVEQIMFLLDTIISQWN